MAEYIKREAALYEIERRKALMVGDNRVSVDAMKSFIKNRPADDVAPVVHGLWEREPASYWRWTPSGAVAVTRTTYRCGLCGRGTAVKSNYCPNCGAKMDGDSDALD